MTSVQDIWDRALDRCDMTGSQFPDTNFALNLVNDALSDLWSAVVNSGGTDWFYKETDIQLVPNVATYTLPADFYKLLKIYLKSGGRLYRIPRFNRDQVDGIYASPQVSATLLMCYVPKRVEYPDMESDIDDLYPEGWLEFCALAVAVKLLLKEESDARAVAAERDRKLGVILASASPRDIGEADVISDKSGRWAQALSRRGALSDVPRFKYRLQGRQLFVFDSAGYLTDPW
jgi:hypothetical protein